VLPFTLLRRLDCVLEATKPAVRAEYQARKHLKMPLDQFLTRKSGQSFYNTSELDFPKLLADPANIKANLIAYIGSFSENARDIFERYDFTVQIEKLDSSNLHPDVVDNHKMGLIFEELIRRFAELSNETAGEHYTPRDVIRLMVSLLFLLDKDVLSTPGVVRSLYDPTGGTGGMLSIADEYITEMNQEARLVLFGQELNPESFAICKADMLVPATNT
jgi:type I restriction enzyme M protein